SDEIAIPGHVQRGDGDPGAHPWRLQLPVAVDVAIPVQPAAEAGARELTGVEVDVGVREPRGQRLRRLAAAEKAPAARDHADVARARRHGGPAITAVDSLSASSKPTRSPTRCSSV